MSTMIQTCKFKCVRCEGTGQVYAHKKKPLGCSARKGQFLHKTYVNDIDKLGQACGGNIDDQLLALVQLKFHAENFSIMTCPDCKGHAIEVYTLEFFYKTPQEPENAA